MKKEMVWLRRGCDLEPFLILVNKIPANSTDKKSRVATYNAPVLVKHTPPGAQWCLP